MSDKETSVLYKAIADFASLSRAVRQAKKDLAELKAEEAALNAASVKGSQQSSAARSSGSKSVEKQVEAFENAAAAATKSEKATTRAEKATANLGKEAKHLATDVERGAKATERHAEALDKVGGSSEKAAAGVRKVKSEVSDMERGFSSAVSWSSKLSDGIKKISEPKSSGIINGPWIALIPLFASLLALVNPLAAGLGAAGVAALGFASNIGSLAGAALGAIPALAALLSVAGAIKVAMGGVGGAFSAYSAAQKAGASGGGSGPQAEQMSQADQITRANEKYKRSIQDVTWAQQDLTQAKKDYFKQVQDLQKAVDREAASEARAAANVMLAKENYANVMADPGSTKGQKMDAKVGVTEAQQAQQDQLAQEKQDRKDLAQLKKEGVNGDRQVIEAQRRVTDAIWAEQDALRSLHDAQNGVGRSSGGAASAQNLFQAALDKLSPSARSVVLQLIAMKGAWTDLRKTVQEEFFSKFVGDIGRLKLLFPPVTSLLSSAAGIAGHFVDTLLRRITGKSFIDDLGIITKQNEPILRNFSRGLMSIFGILEDLTVAAGPFVGILTGKMADGLKTLSDIVHVARNDGSLASWLDKVNGRLSTWWKIISNIALALWNYGAATSKLGDSLTSSFEKMTEGWLGSAKKAREAGSPFQEYLKNVRPAISEMSKLLGDFFRWFAKTSEDPTNIKAFTDIFHIIRTDLGPALSDLFKTLTKSGIGQQLAQAISNIATAIDELLKHGGIEGIKAFWNAISLVAKAVLWISQIPGLAPLIGVLATTLMTLSILRFTGILQLITFLLRLADKKGLIGIFDAAARAGKGGATAAAATADGAAAAEAGAAGRYAAGTRRGAGGGSANAASGASRAEIIAAEKAAAKRGETAGARGGTVVTGAGKSRLKNGLNFDPETGEVFPPTNERSSALAAERAAAGPQTRAEALAAERSIGGRAARAGEGLALGAARGGSAIGRIGVGALKGAARGLTRGGIPGLVAGVAGGAILDGVVRDGKGGARDLGADVGGAALTGAGIGATVGSIIPGVGTAIGAGAGAVVGAGISLAQAKPEQYKKTGDDIGKWWKGVIKSWSDGWDQISGWFDKNIIKPFSTGIKNIVNWWNKNVVRPFADAAKNVSDWWNHEVVRPAKAIMAAIGRLWDDFVVKPAQRVMKNVGDWWHDHVVIPAQKIMHNVGVWWHDHVVIPAQTIMHNVGVWWHDHVVIPAQTIMRNVGTWWHDHVVIPAQTVMRNVGTWWHDHVVIPAQTIMRGIGDAWQKWVVNPISDFASNVADGWQRWVIDPLSQFFGAIGDFIYKVTHFNLADWITNTANGVDPHRNSGGMIYRAAGGGVGGTGNGDTVRARLTPGEFILRKGIVDKIGLDNLQMLNSGVLTFAQMLRNSAQAQDSKTGFAGNFGAGLVPHLPTVSVPQAASLTGRGAEAGQAAFHVENLTVNNPKPERATDSLPKTIRKLTYLGAKR